MSFLEALQKMKYGLRSTETLVKTSAGDVFLEKRDESGDPVVEKLGFGPGYIVDLRPDLQVVEVIQSLLMGSQDVALDEGLVRAHNITHILSVGIQVNEIPGVKHTFVNALDLPEFNMNPVFSECTRIIDEERKSGGIIFVHCNAGISRSSSVIIAYLMKSERLNYLEAYELLKRKRPCVKPNDGFVKQLKLLYEN